MIELKGTLTWYTATEENVNQIPKHQTIENSSIKVFIWMNDEIDQAVYNFHYKIFMKVSPLLTIPSHFAFRNRPKQIK